MKHCEFCGWECSNDTLTCPKGCGYKGLIRWRDDPELDAKIRAMEADPEYQAREP